MARDLIYGTLEYCYDGMPVIRGFAPYKVLLENSEAHPAYQRQIHTDHVTDIESFLKSPSSIKFMPEIVLSYDYSGLVQAPGDWTKPELSTPLDYLYSAAEKTGKSVALIDNHTGVKFTRYKSSNSQNKLVSIDVSPKRLLSKSKVFQRIDGNHRLQAMEKAGIESFIVPFCIILLANGDGKFSSEKAKIEMEIFHNINAKGKPLSPIEQYRGLLNIFTVDELQMLYGTEFSTTKIYMDKYKEVHFHNLAAFFSDTEDLVLFCVKFFKERGYDTITDEELMEIYSELEHTYFSDYLQLKACKNRFAIVPYVYYCYSEGRKRNAKLDAYNTWFLKNKLYDVKEFDPSSMIEVFDKIYELRKKQIFVAMPFVTELDFVFNAITEVVNDINHENHIDLPLPVRIDKQVVGASYDIVNEILDRIQEAGLLIADLTNQNANVYYEAGFAQGLIRARIGDTAQILYLISNPDQPDQPFDKAKFDVQHYKMLQYKNDGNGVNELKRSLKVELKAFYSI